MSGKNRIYVAESLIPADLTTSTLGSNYGLEGYEDMQYGMGVLEGVLDPDLLPPPPCLPDCQKGLRISWSWTRLSAKPRSMT